MFVEIIDSRPSGQLVDMDPGAANELIRQGRAKRAFSDPSPALPPKPGGYSGTYVATKPSPASEAPPIFASGGIIEAEGGLVGEQGTDCFIPHETGEKLSKKKKTR